MKQLISAEEIQKGVAQLARQLTEVYGEKPLTIVGVLTGSLVMLADLIRQLEMPLRVALIQAGSYGGATTTRGALTINDELLPELKDRDVVLLDDIFDTGHTLVQVLDELHKHKPSSVRTVVLLRKRERCEVDLQPDHIVFDIPNEFVVGYGLDYDDMYRNLPYVAVLEPQDIHK